YNGKIMKNALPVLTAPDFGTLYTPHPPSCEDQIIDPGTYFKERWYAYAVPEHPTDPLSSIPALPGEGVAHAYVRNSAEVSHRFIPYIKCINTEDDGSWESVGAFTASGLDMGVKSAAGLLHQFMHEANLADTTPPSVTLSTGTTSPTN